MQMNQKPHFPPFRRKPNISPEGGEKKGMTIAAGFCCKDGIVLCADTEISHGNTGKTYASKIFCIDSSQDCYLSYTGDVEFASELVEKLEAATKTGAAILESIKTIYRRFWNKHYIQPPKSEKTWAYLLVTIREGSKVLLYRARGRHFTRVDDYWPLGIGEDQGHALFAPLYKNGAQLNMEEMAFLAINAMRSIKTFIQGCGGNTQVYEIPHRQDFLAAALGLNWHSESIKKVESDCELFDSQMHNLRLAFLQADEMRFRESIKQAGRILLRRLETKRKEFHRQQKLYEKERQQLERER